MAQLLLTQDEHNQLSNISTFEKNRNVIGIIVNELGLSIKIDDVQAAAERIAVLAAPKTKRKYMMMTPQQYYELFLIYKTLVLPADVIKQLLSYVTGATDAGFPRYLMPQSPIIEVPRVITIGQTYTFFFRNARPLTMVTIKVKDDTNTTTNTFTPTADVEGAGSFTFVAPAGTFITVESNQIVVTNAESGNGDLIHDVISYVAEIV